MRYVTCCVICNAFRLALLSEPSLALSIRASCFSWIVSVYAGNDTQKVVAFHTGIHQQSQGFRAYRHQNPLSAQ